MGAEDCGRSRCGHRDEGEQPPSSKLKKKTLQTSNLARATALQVEKVLGIDTPAYKAGLKAGDVLVEVQGELITMMTHPQVNIF